jgi:hypothetical protein
MEAEILAATSLLVEGIMVKQFLRFLLGDEGGLENSQRVQMRLWLDSASAQAFFNRLGPGRAKHTPIDQAPLEPTSNEKEIVSCGKGEYAGKPCRPQCKTSFS